VADATVSHQAGKKVYAELATAAATRARWPRRLGLIQVRDEGALEAWVDEVLAAHPTR
jgi:Asp-tRNA(Asn)/Glu-tRNA(Gln) amidotransferase B subunit